MQLGPGGMDLLLDPADLIIALAAVNCSAFAAFGIDKARAAAGTRRTAESTLLLLAALGGTPGAYAGRRLFRHKTRKQPFVRQLHTIAGLQVLGLGALLGWQLGG